MWLIYAERVRWPGPRRSRRARRRRGRPPTSFVFALAFPDLYACLDPFEVNLLGVSISRQLFRAGYHNFMQDIEGIHFK
ncbi:unnamed protein product, partial [Iphiclides podalirius]